MASLLDKLVKNSTIKMTAPISESKVYGKKEMAPTQVPMINVALSGRVDGGLIPGLLLICGPSKHFKSAFALLMAGAYMKKNPDAVLLFYDSEFGTPQSYFESFGIDMRRVVHTPITNVEELKFDITQQLEKIEKDDKVVIVIDSVGNLASKKEVDDALDGKSVADMSRAKALKSLFRIVTPHLNLKDIPLIAVNHVYKEIGAMYAKDIVSGGCVVAGTEIQTPDGLKKVEDFAVGDLVLTTYGENMISHVWNPETLEEGNPECYEITFDDGHTVICSENHKFLIDDNWVSARDLVAGMECETLKS
jgi:RecA/RadA recombinase